MTYVVLYFIHSVEIQLKRSVSIIKFNKTKVYYQIFIGTVYNVIITHCRQLYKYINNACLKITIEYSTINH